jgi:phage terminase large subunit GpA-like protein
MRSGAEVFRRGFLDGLRPKPQITVSEWADRHRVLSQKSTNEYGPWRTDRTPYLREIMDCLSEPSPVQRVVFQKGSQIGGSEAGYNFIGYVIHHAPAPTLMVVPRLEDARKISKQRIDPMIESCPVLRERVSDPRARDSKNSTYLKEFPGGLFSMVGANSAAGLRSMPAKNLFFDEVDEFTDDVDGEGDPVELALRRTGTYRTNRKVYMASSPTIEGRSRIAAEYELTDRRVFLVPCPACGTFQEITWRGHIRWVEADPKTVYFECEACHAHVLEGQKTKMLAAGFWKARNPEAPANVRGYLLSALYSPVGWYSWEMAVVDFLKAKKKPTLLKVFVNTVLAETFKQKGEAPEWERIYDRREPYAFGSVPKGGLLLTMGVDVQKDRLQFEVVAWGRGLESWSIQAGEIPGDPTRPAVWQQLALDMAKTYSHEGGVALSLRAVGVDTGFATQHVYRWIRTQVHSRVFAMKGTDDHSALIAFSKAVEVQHEGKRLQRGLKLWQVGGPVAKSELYSFLRLARPTEEGEPYPAGYCHFPEYPAEFFKQLTAEQVKESLNRRGYREFTWEKTRDRNEALDCRVYARAAAAILGIDRFPDAEWARLEGNLGVGGEAPARPARPQRRKRNPRPSDDDDSEFRKPWR